MKVRNILLGALVTLMVAPSFAQTQNQKKPDPICDQVTAIIKSNAPDAEKQIKAIAKENKKNIDGLVSIGKAYLIAKDYANAKAYGQQAADIVAAAGGKIANATPFILLGNIAVAQDDGGEAAQQFQQAMYFDKKNPDGYRRYAGIMSKTDPAGAAQTLENLKAERPDIDINMIAANIYYSAQDVDGTLKYLNKTGMENLDEAWLGIYAGYNFAKNDIPTTLKAAEYGHNKWPKDITFNRLLLLVNNDKKNYEAAIKAGQDLFQTPADSLNASDFGTYASALQGGKKYAEAIEIYQKFMNLPKAPKEQKDLTNKAISDCYIQLGDFTKAGEYLQKYIATQPESFSTKESLAQFYAAQVADEKTTAAQKDEAYKKADAIYAELAEKYPDNAVYCANKRGTLAFQMPGDDMAKLKLAAPHFETIITLIGDKADRSKAETTILKNSLNYCMINYFKNVNGGEPKAKELALKLLELDPENATAKAIADAVK